MPPKVVRRRVRKVRDDIEIYSFRTRKIARISRRAVIARQTGGNANDGVEVGRRTPGWPWEDPGEGDPPILRHSRVTEVSQDQFSDR